MSSDVDAPARPVTPWALPTEKLVCQLMDLFSGNGVGDRNCLSPCRAGLAAKSTVADFDSSAEKQRAAA
jgi:hypothetical protein